MPSIFSIKSLDSILREAKTPGLRLRQALGPVQITLLGIGAIIGAGIFATIGTAAAGDVHRLGAGPGLILSFGLAAVVCAFVALCYAEFASLVPISGSAYTYSYATLGEMVAWVIGWDLIIEYAVGNVAVAISWSNYFKTLMRGAGFLIPDWLSTDFQTAHKIPGLFENAPQLLGVPIVFNLLAFLIVAAVTIVLLIGIRESAWFNAGMVIFKLAVLIFFIVVGWRYVRAENWQPFLPNGWQGLASGAAVIFFAYIGFDAVSTVAEEAKRPQRDLPIGIIASLIICTLFYIVVAAVFTGIIPFGDLTQRLSTQQAEPLTLAFEYAHLGNLAIFIVALGSVIAHTAVLFVFQLGQPRIFFSMARDGLLPPIFARVHPRFRTPWGSTILTGLAVGVAAMFTSLDEMVDLTNIGTLFAFILVSVGVIILRWREPDRHRPFKVPGGVILPVLGALGCLGLIYYLPPTSWLRFTAWLNLGFIIYIAYGALHSRLTGCDQAVDSASHSVQTARVGAWLGVAGTVLMFISRGADIIRLGAAAPPNWFFQASGWLIVPLLMNLVILYPLVLARTGKARKRHLAEKDRQLSRVTLILATVMILLTGSYLLAVWFV